jgi:hypothetical protein
MDSGGELQILSRALAVLTADQLVLDPVTLVQIVEPGPLDGRDVHESVGPAAVRLDKPISLGSIEPLHSSGIQDSLSALGLASRPVSLEALAARILPMGWMSAFQRPRKAIANAFGTQSPVAVLDRLQMRISRVESHFTRLPCSESARISLLRVSCTHDLESRCTRRDMPQREAVSTHFLGSSGRRRVAKR